MVSISGFQLEDLHLPSMRNGDTTYTGFLTVTMKEKKIRLASFKFNRLLFLMKEREKFKNGQNHMEIKWLENSQPFESKVSKYYKLQPNPLLGYYPDCFHMIVDELLFLVELEREYASLSTLYQYVLFQFTLRRDVPYLYQEGKRDSYRIYYTNERTHFMNLQERLNSGKVSFFAVKSKDDFFIE